MFQLGTFQFNQPLVLAPMAGVTDLPFRRLARSLGADLTVSEMMLANDDLWDSRKSQQRRDHSGEPGPIMVQIAGSDPQLMAQTAQRNVEAGAQVIDINIGCPVKKVCNKLAGSALLQDPALVERILKAVVQAVDVPVTLKTRTGWSAEHKNGPLIAKIAEQAGIQLLSLHGRTREDRYQGAAEYDTIAQIKASLSIPVLANGDIDSPEKALAVLKHTQADGLLIGRAAQGNPWIFAQIKHFLATGKALAKPSLAEVAQVLRAHLEQLHQFYGELAGPRIARKHLGWYLAAHYPNEQFRQHFNSLTLPAEQLAAVDSFFQTLDQQEAVA